MRNKSKEKLTTEYGGKTKVQQHQKDETDIHQIVEKYANGMVPQNTGEPMYMDMYNTPTFHAAQNIVAEVTQKFQQLDSRLRARFANNPAKLITFMESTDKENIDESIKLGLRPKPQEKVEEIKPSLQEAEKTPGPDKETGKESK